MGLGLVVSVVWPWREAGPASSSPRKNESPYGCLPALDAGPLELGPTPSSLALLTESELLSSAGPEGWGAMGAGWLMTTRGEASRGPAGEEPGSPRSHRP